jgi:hypothetical protein
MTGSKKPLAKVCRMNDRHRRDTNPVCPGFRYSPDPFSPTLYIYLIDDL